MISKRWKSKITLGVFLRGWGRVTINENLWSPWWFFYCSLWQSIGSAMLLIKCPCEWTKTFLTASSGGTGCGRYFPKSKPLHLGLLASYWEKFWAALYNDELYCFCLTVYVYVCPLLIKKLLSMGQRAIGQGESGWQVIRVTGHP